MKDIISLLFPIQRHLHTHPELSFNEFRTSAFIAQTLKSWHIPFHPFTNIKTGGYCDVGEGPVVAFRSDIDALPIVENESHPVKSSINGVMHACGHDFHTTIGLGLAKYFRDHPQALNHKTLRIFFQPGEEAAPGGGELVVAEPSWDAIQCALAVHVTPKAKTSRFLLFDGPVQASSTSLKIQLNGPGGHTSKPEETLDLIRLSAIFIEQLQTFLEDSLKKDDKLVFAFGMVKGGDTHNIIPQSVLLRGSFRTLDNVVLEQTMKRITEFSVHFDKTHGTTTTVRFPTNCPATINNSSLAQSFARFMKDTGHAGQLIENRAPSMGADDFAFYARKVPGLYLIVGGGGSGTLHSGDLVLDEKLIEPTLDTLAGFIDQLDLSTIR